MRKNCRKWTDEELIHAIQNSKNLREVLIKLNIFPGGGNYKYIRQHIERLQINTNHFTISVYGKHPPKQLNKRIRIGIPSVQRKWTYSDLQDVVPISFSYRQVILSLGLHYSGGTCITIRNAIKKLNIDVSHFTGKLSNKGKEFARLRPIEFYLVKGSTISTHKLRQRLIHEKIFEAKCYNCNNNEWLGVPIPLELEHKDGDNTNNVLNNLTLLCPNCHALTPTYRGKNKRRV